MGGGEGQGKGRRREVGETRKKIEWRKGGKGKERESLVTSRFLRSSENHADKQLPPTYVRCQSNEREDGDIVSNANDEDEPQSEWKVLDVFEADLLSRPVLLPLDDFLGSLVKEAKEHGTEQGEDAETKTYSDVEQTWPTLW